MSDKNMCYAGIGSREMPVMHQQIMFKISAWLGKKGFILRSGGAGGADQICEKGCDSVGGLKQIFLPWPGFENSTSTLVVKSPTAHEIAAKYHPCYERLSSGAQKLQARNSHQVLGWDLRSPSKFVICYTKNGSGAGGTGQALRISEDYGIPVFDLGNYTDIAVARVEFMKFYESHIK